MKKKNFTLVELLCASALVAILAGIGFSAYSFASYRGKEAATKSLVSTIEAALKTVKNKHNFYPASSSYGDITVNVNGSTGMITGIKFGGTAISKEKQLKDFLAVVDGELLKKYIVNGKVADAWGGAIQYKYPGAVNTTSFDLVAPGQDEKFGNNESDTPPGSIDGYKQDDEWSCDDIANFR
jgi:prepilin-type N-terminal cleavage/methylation domain-containing protein